jgi:signal transduction histidine kinase
VVDRGIGIPADDLPRVFERFHRGANVDGIAGSGVGLAGAKQAVEGSGGSIAVESAEGEGSTFTIRLPAVASPSPIPRR